MAGRESKTVGSGRAEKLFTNLTGGAIVATIHAVSADNTKNPTVSIAVDTNAARELNFISAGHTLSQGLTTRKAVEADLTNTPKVLGSNTAVNQTRMTLNGTGNSSYSSASYSSHHMYIDPYFFTNPDAFGKASAAHIIRYSTTMYLKTDIAADKSLMRNYIDYSSVSGSGSNIDQINCAYADAGGCVDTYTDCFINFATNAYMSGGHFYNNGSTTTQQSTNQTSDSCYYNFTGSSYNPNSYKYNDPMKIDMASDAGLFVGCMHPSKTAQNSYKIFFISANKFRNGNTTWNGTWKNYTNLTGGTNFVGYAYSYAAQVNLNVDGGYLASWMKYNPTTKKFYFNMQGGGSDTGIWSVDHDDLFPASNGMSSGNNLSMSVMSKEVATNPLTSISTEPMRIGASLWQIYTGTGEADVRYSKDLINWLTASELTGQATAVAVYHDTVAAKNYFTQTSNQTKLYAANTGFALVDQAGTLEKSLPVGTYERNGIILNSGDSIYIENADETTDVQATVMYVEV